jgi:hypothetical protein
MVVQLTTYLVFFLPLYYSFQTFQFINTSPSEKHVFVLKSQVEHYDLQFDFVIQSCMDQTKNHNF